MPSIASRSLSLLVGMALLATAGSGPAVAKSTDKAREGTLSLTAASQSRDGNNRDVRIHNQTGVGMVELQASSGSGWTGDLLGSRGLAAGRSAVVAIDDGTGACRYALRARLDTGETVERGGVNSCQIADYYFTR